MNLESRIKNITDDLAPIILGAYLLIVISRWLHPALFTPRIALVTLLIGVGVIVSTAATPARHNS